MSLFLYLEVGEEDCKDFSSSRHPLQWLKTQSSQEGEEPLEIPTSSRGNGHRMKMSKSYFIHFIFDF